MATKLTKKTKKTLTMKAEKLLKKFHIRQCQVNLVPLSLDNVEFKMALFQKYHIQDCCVRLHRLADDTASKSAPEKKTLPKPKIKTVRELVSWIPTVSTTVRNSNVAICALAAHCDSNSQNSM